MSPQVRHRTGRALTLATRCTPPSPRRTFADLSLPMAAGPGRRNSQHSSVRKAARDSFPDVLRSVESVSDSREEIMNRHFQLPGQLRNSLIAGLIASALLTAPLLSLTAAGEGSGEVAGARQSGEAAGASYSTSRDDQTDLSVTVYNSD